MSFTTALTGGIASGKSTVGSILEQRGWKVIDSDRIAHELMEPHQENWQKIIDAFGGDVLKQDQTIDRRVLGDMVFHDSLLREKLNTIVHPGIRRVWRDELARSLRERPDQPAVVIIPLLFEKNLQEEFSRVICVGCSHLTQEKRLRDRLLDDRQINARLASQWPVAEKMRRAGLALWNEGSLEALHRQVDCLPTSPAVDSRDRD